MERDEAVGGEGGGGGVENVNLEREDEERRENPKYGGEGGSDRKMQRWMQRPLEPLQCASFPHFADAVPDAATARDRLSRHDASCPHADSII
jgi:hypothetical protein